MASLQLNCRSKSENHFSIFNKIIKSATASKEVTNQESSSGNVDYSALKLISDFLMEEEEEDKACMVHDSLALQAIEKSFYDALHNTNLDQNTLHVGDYFLDCQLLSPPSEGYFGPFHLSSNDYYPSHYDDSQQNNNNKIAAGDCLKMVKKKRNVADTFFDDDDDKVLFGINGESEEQSQAKKKCSRR